MRNIFYIAIAVLIASCAKEEKQEQTEQQQITLQATFSENTKATATAFEAGDELGLFVVKQGMDVQKDGNLVNNARMLVANDGTIKGDPTAVYYPSKTTLNLYSYYPYQSGDATADALGVQVGIRTDQTDFSAIKRSDLCFGFLDNVEPSATAKAITFTHKFAQVRINISTYVGCEAVKQVRLINIKDSALLNIQTGAITLKPHIAEVKTNKSAENSFLAIIPAQQLNGACIAIDLDGDKTFIYNAVNPINLTQSATNTLSLTINDKHVVTLNGTPTITNWNTKNTSSNISQPTDNAFTFYWSPAITDFNKVNKAFVTLTNPSTSITKRFEVSGFVIDPLSTAANAIYRFNLSKADQQSVGYPSTIDKLELFNGTTAIHTLTDYYGKTITRSGEHTFGTVTSIKLNPTGDWTNVSGYGASRTITVTTTGNTDWTATATGAGLTVSPTSGKSGDKVIIRLVTHGGITKPATRLGKIAFETNPKGVSTTINTTQNGVIDRVRINNLVWAAWNVGASSPTGYGNYYTWDQALTACRGEWRQPTVAEFATLIAAGIGEYGNYNGKNGRWLGTNPGNENTSVFFPAAGNYDNYIGEWGYVWFSNANDESTAYYLSFNSATLWPSPITVKTNTFPVRCVQ